jgi:predicted nucleic acid-binding protein
MKVYLDASAIIYAIEGALPLRQKVLDRLTEAQSIPGSTIVTSQLSRLECRVKPLRDGNS